jgi:hypothetical protein
MVCLLLSRILARAVCDWPIILHNVGTPVVNWNLCSCVAATGCKVQPVPEELRRAKNMNDLS